MRDFRAFRRPPSAAITGRRSSPSSAQKAMAEFKEWSSLFSGELFVKLVVYADESGTKNSPVAFVSDISPNHWHAGSRLDAFLIMSARFVGINNKFHK